MEGDEILDDKRKAEVAAALRVACSEAGGVGSDPELWEKIVDKVFINPRALCDVDDEETLDWCRWLVAGGATPEEFSETVRQYDKTTTCGLVWTENFVAYRCRTCGISPFISLCTDCFHKGNHEGHDFIVFRSETGGACDCGEINVIKESGCCVLHGPRGTAAMQRTRSSMEEEGNENERVSGNNDLPLSSSSSSSSSESVEQSAPPELFSVANKVMPRLFHRLIAYLRTVEARKLARAQQLAWSKSKKKSKPKTSPTQNVSLAATAAAMMANPAVNAPPKGHKFLKLLQGFSDMGLTMRQVMTRTLTNTPAYRDLCGTVNVEHERLGLKIPEHNKTFLDELVYWTVKREFPEDLVCLLLSLRSDYKYNECLARAFITHYELISQSILKSSDPERLCKHIAAVSVQLFSKEKLAIAMVEQMQLLHLLLRSLHEMIKSTAIPISSLPAISSSAASSSTTTPPSLTNETKSETQGKVVDDVHQSSCSSSSSDISSDSSTITCDEDEVDNESILKVIDCDNDIIKNNYYWLIKSDLKALLSHGPVATKFFNDPQLLSTWFEFLTLLQGMNVNKYVRKGEPHVEHEPDSYVGAFMAELVISAMLMWTLVSHLKDGTTSDITLNFVDLCKQQLKQWHQYVQYPKGTISFHLPLHRYFSTFIHQGLQFQGIQMEKLLPPEEEFDVIVQHILRLQVAYYEISSRLWARNGPSLVNQAEYYVSSLCCNSMVDADLFLLQMAAVRMPGISEEKFLRMAINEFGMTDVLSIRRCFGEERETKRSATFEEVSEEEITMLENFMIFLAIITTVRTNLGMKDKDLMALEMAVLLCKSDRLHSELMEMLPERCGSDAQLKNFETVLENIADFQAPRNMQQGIFAPKPCVWEEIYDPVYTLLRSSSRADYQSSRDRFLEFVKRSKKEINANNLWPPFRVPSVSPTFMPSPGKVLLTKLFMECAFIILHHKLNSGVVSELTVSLCVYLLEVAVCVADSGKELVGFLTEITLPQRGESGNTKSECVLTLLLELYSKFSDGKSFTLKPENCEEELPSTLVENRIGDGTFFVAKILQKLADKCDECRFYISRVTGSHEQGTSPCLNDEPSQEEREREERRRKAKERKLLLMNEYAMKRQQFMTKSGDAFEDEEVSSAAASSRPEDLSNQPSSLLKEYLEQECVICMEKLESKPSNPFGLMTHLSPCHVLGYQRLHTPDGDGPFIKTIHKEALTESLKFYEDSSVIQHIPLDPGYGVQVQSCGHLIHQDCFTSYMNYVKKSPSSNSSPSSSGPENKNVHSFTYKEYTCPLCRQVGNSFLPVILTNFTSKSSESGKQTGNFDEISKLIKKRNKCALSNAEKQAVDRFIKDINGCALSSFDSELVKILQEFDVASPLISAFWLTSHLRVAVERQLKLNEGSVSNSSSSAASSSSTKKVSSLLPLLSVMKYQYKSLPVGYGRKLAQNWGLICGKRNAKGNSREVPTLLRDVDTGMYHLTLDLPIMDDMTKGKNLFHGVVQALYNLKAVQVLASICSQFSDAEKVEIAETYVDSHFRVERMMHLIFKNFNVLKLNPSTSRNDEIMKADLNGNHKNVEVPETSYVENLVQTLLLPFLQTAAHLKYELFGSSVNPPKSFLSLVQYLKLGQLGQFSKESENNSIGQLDDGNGDEEWNNSSFANFLLWRKGDDDAYVDCEVAIENWCSELIQSLYDSGSGKKKSGTSVSEQAGELLKSHLYIFDKPSLIKLPKNYDTIFEKYRKVNCLKCDQVPSTPALCLICGEIICLNDLCCFDLQMEVSEAVSHCQRKCGRGTGIFLSVMTSEILIVREKEACIWGSIFLDSFCEEDLELKRGKPLFLCQERLDILQRNWITQSFYKADLKWFPHENFL